MRVTYDPNKNAWNIAERGLSFDRAHDFDFVTAKHLIDARHDYHEIRHIAIGLLDGQLHVLCYVVTDDGIRVISFRRANRREIRDHGTT